MALVGCKCGTVALRFADSVPCWRLECCCYDCYAALWYCEIKLGGPPRPAQQCVDSVYFANDFSVEKGLDRLGAMKNFEQGDTTRFYCKDCASIVVADHPAYGCKIALTQASAYSDFEGLKEAELSAPRGRHQLADLPEGAAAELPAFAGPAEFIYDKCSQNLLDALPAIFEEHGKTGEMNCQVLLAAVGPVFVPSDEDERMRGGPATLMGGDPKASEAKAEGKPEPEPESA